MVNYEPEHLNKVFSALSDPTRRAILKRLTQGELSVSELASPFEMSLPAISKHLRVLENARLIHRRREGRVHYLSLVAQPMQSAADWLNSYRNFWENSLDALQQLVETEDEAE